MNSKIKGLIWLVSAVAVTVVVAVGLPQLAKMMPWSFERKLGNLTSFDSEKVCSGTAGDTALQVVLKRLYPLFPDDHFPLKVEIVHGMTVNAFAGLGGRIYVYEGLLRQAASAEELAGVLTHEMAHVKRRHVVQGLMVRLGTAGALQLIFGDVGTMGSEAANALLNMKFSREQESEADAMAMERLAEGHVDPAGLKHFFETMAELHDVPAILSDHPSNDERITMAGTTVVKDIKPLLSKEQWTALRTICD